MSQKRISRRPQCSHDNCGSRRLHVGDDGFTYCDQGHQQSELGTVIAEDTGELTVHGKTSRRKLESDAESTTSRVTGFTGPRAFEHYLLCLQLILRRQLRFLIDVKKLPTDLETVVRDLWVLRLQKLSGRVYSYRDEETDTEATSSRMFSSQSEGGSGTDTATGTSSRRSKSAAAKREEHNRPTLIELVALSHVGTLLLRLPFTISDFHGWINGGKLLFYRAAKEVPLSMRDRLPGYFQEQLEPQDLVAPEALHHSILGLLSTLNADFGMTIPSINHPLVLYRWLKRLCLPLEVYVATQRLGRLLNLDYTYHLESKARAKMNLRFPEVRLMTLIVISVKLLFPFDEIKRDAKSANELSALQMDWELWIEVQSTGQGAEGDPGVENPLSFDDAYALTERQSLELAGKRLDEYLDWYEQNIASEEIRSRGRAGREANFRKTLFKMFPTIGPLKSAVEPREHSDEIASTGKILDEKLLEVQGALRPRGIVKDDDTDEVPRAGSFYSQVRGVDDLDGSCKRLYEIAAQLTGMSLRSMVRAVFYMERRLMKLEEHLNKDRQEQSE